MWRSLSSIGPLWTEESAGRHADNSSGKKPGLFGRTFCEMLIGQGSNRFCYGADSWGSRLTAKRAPKRGLRHGWVWQKIESQRSRLHNPCGSARGPVILPNFKLGDPSLRGRNGGFDSHTLPPISCVFLLAGKFSCRLAGQGRPLRPASLLVGIAVGRVRAKIMAAALPQKAQANAPLK